MSTRSKSWLLIAALTLIASAARSDGIGPRSIGLNVFGGIGQQGAAVTPPPLTNLRITNTGAFRITNTSANRAVSP